MMIDGFAVGKMAGAAPEKNQSHDTIHRLRPGLLYIGFFLCVCYNEEIME